MAGEWISGTTDESNGMVRTQVEGCWVDPTNPIAKAKSLEEQQKMLLTVAQMTGSKFIIKELTSK